MSILNDSLAKAAVEKVREQVRTRLRAKAADKSSSSARASGDGAVTPD